MGIKWGKVGLNHRPTDYESAALTTELLPRGEDYCMRIGFDNQGGDDVGRAVL